MDYPLNLFEVVIVDDGGETPLDDLLAPFSERDSVTLVRQDHGGGVRHDKGVVTECAYGCNGAGDQDRSYPV